MAKAKKTESAKEPAKPAAAKKSPAAEKKPTRSAKPAAGGTSASLIDTSLAAKTAAAMIASRGASSVSSQGGSSQESASFKNFKQSLTNPSAGALGNILGAGGGQKKSSQQFGGPKQIGGKNQTFGADVNRSGVPRRTSGG